MGTFPKLFSETPQPLPSPETTGPERELETTDPDLGYKKGLELLRSGKPVKILDGESLKEGKFILIDEDHKHALVLLPNDTPQVVKISDLLFWQQEPSKE